MKKNYLTLIVLTLFAINVMALTKDYKKEALTTKKIDFQKTSSSKAPFVGTDGGIFDGSVNGYGWYQGYNRKIQVNMDPLTGPMFGSVYRQNNTDANSGQIGGMIGSWATDTFNGYTSELMPASSAWAAPGGRYPYANEFINGYFFGTWNDYEGVATTGMNSLPVFAVADATFGADWALWSDNGIIEATEGGAIPVDAWCPTGDVVYDAATGYYYWMQSWRWRLGNWTGNQTSFVIGRTLTPGDITSWVWSDYNDEGFDCTADDSPQLQMLDSHIAYAKDIYGNGTGKGIIVNAGNDYNDSWITSIDSIGWNDSLSVTIWDTVTVDLGIKINYMYTTNWGGDYSTGDWKPNWKKRSDGAWFQVEPSEIFDWIGTAYTTTDTLQAGNGSDSLVTYETVIDDASINWDCSAIATEYDQVHILARVYGSTTDPDSPWAGWTIYGNDDGDLIGGYYDIRGTITDTGVIWHNAVFIANVVGMDTDTVEWQTDMAIGYAGYGQIYATWLDKPVSRGVVNPYAEADQNSAWIDDAYFSYSDNDGLNWETDKTVTFDYTVGPPVYPTTPYVAKYAKNITNSKTLHEEGWQIANHGMVTHVDGTTSEGALEVYAIHQYYDVENSYDPALEYFDHEQFLHVWKITGKTTGITTEDVAIDMDFQLMQNYPNPFNPSTEINFKIQNDAKVKLTVFNSKGESVVSLVDGKMAKGLHKVNFDATELNSGIYFYQLDVNGMKSTKKMVLAK
ncbi:MAG: T9SS type A sorting domain-containing protein [Candidatus Delongbacteria bacterium]|jgi:hypothetical protein|nr:T9SS type A sorting domain-containing protein [Candidatus Delongbacteria bacterium]